MSLRIKEGVKIKGSVNVKIMYYVLLSNWKIGINSFDKMLLKESYFGSQTKIIYTCIY